MIKWGIIGCGNVTEKKSGPAFSKTLDFELFGVMRRNEEKAKDYAFRHHVPHYFTHAEDLINHPEIDAIYIATPPDSHKYYALQVAHAGKPCGIEKPMAVNYQECSQILKAFEEKGLPLFVAYYRRSLPRFKQIKQWLEQGEIGEIRHINWDLCKVPSSTDLAKTYNWRTDAKIAPGGYFDDLASHGLNLFAYYFGEITSANGLSLNQQKLYSAKDAVVANWLHETGVTGSGTWNFGSFERKDEVEIIGSKGKIEFAVFDEKPVVLTNQNGISENFIEHPENIQLYHVQNIRDHLLGKIVHPSLGKSAAQTNWVMDKILGVV